VAHSCLRHAFAARLFLSRTDSTLQISGQVTRYREESNGAQALQSAHEQWAERIPGDEGALWEWCLAQEQSTLLELLAYCAGRTVNAVQMKHDRTGEPRLTHANALSTALKLDMAQWFTPTAGNFFSRVARPIVVKSITEAKGTPAKRSWEKLRKSELAAVAEHEILGTGWLPEPLRA